MRRLSLVLLIAASAACGSSTDNSKPSSPYNIAVVSQTSGGGGANPYITAFTLEVTLKADGSVQSGVRVVTQVTAGDVATLPLDTGANGQVSATWTIQPADQSPGATETLAFCAAPPGSHLCDTNLNGPNVIQVTF